MNKGNKVFSLAISTSLCLAALPLAGCKHQDTTPAASIASGVPAIAASSPLGASTPTPAPAPAAIVQAVSAPDAYTLPNASQLYELLAPIALFPDNLVAQVLAGSTYPDQIGSADQWLAQHQDLKGTALLNAVDQQPWDASIKALTGFHNVLDQMARNIPWTSALGEAYANDPTDVMNAIQVLRQRAAEKGTLKSDARQKVSTLARVSEPSAGTGSQDDLLEGSLIVPPPQTILIEPAQPGIVYVPAYNPTVVYGIPMPLYPGYVYAPPAYDVLATGLVSFGVGVAVGVALNNNHNWGWSAWGAHWGPGYAGGWVAHGGYGVAYHNGPYVSHSTTIVNHVNNIHAGPWDHPNFGHDVNRHIINSYSNNGTYWNSHGNESDFRSHPATRPNFAQPDHRANLTQSGRFDQDRPAHPLNERPNPVRANSPMSRGSTTQSSMIQSPMNRPENLHGEQARTAAMPANHPNLQQGLAKPALSSMREPAVASARTAPFADRGFGGGASEGLGHWRRR